MEFQTRTTIETAAAQLFRAMDGIGTDEKSIHRILAGKSREELVALRAVYADHYGGRSLDADLKGELSGTDLEEAQAALSGDPIEQAAAALRNAAKGAGTDTQKIHDTLTRITKLTEPDPRTGKPRDPAAREKLMAAFQRRDGRSLDEMLRAELSGSELQVSQKEAAGDRAGAAALRLKDAMFGGISGLGTDEQRINEVLEQLTDQSARQALLTAYEKETGRTLSFDLNRELSGAEQDLSLALISDGVFAQDARSRCQARAQIAASRLAIASQGIGTDEDAIFKQFEGVTEPCLRLEIKRAFNDRYGRKVGGRDYADMIEEELSGNDLERANQVARSGRMDPAFALKYAMEGAGTDEDLIRETLRQCKTDKELDALRKKYAALKKSRDPDLLERDLEKELSGRDGFEIRQLLRGAGTQGLSARQKISFANRAHEFERGASAGWLGNAVTDLFSDSGKMLELQHHRLQALDEKRRTGDLTADDLARLETITGYHAQDVQNLQAARDAITNSGALLGTGIVGTALTIGTWGTAGAGVAAVLGALGSGATELGLRLALQGDSYAEEDLAADLAKTLVAAAVGGAASPIGQAARRAAELIKSSPRLAHLVGDAVKGGQGGLVNGTAAGLFDERTFRGSENGAANFGRQLIRTTLGNSASSVVSGALSRGLGLEAARWNGLNGVPGSAASGTVQTAIDNEGHLSSDTLVDAFSKN